MLCVRDLIEEFLSEKVLGGTVYVNPRISELDDLINNPSEGIRISIDLTTGNWVFADSDHHIHSSMMDVASMDAENGNDWLVGTMVFKGLMRGTMKLPNLRLFGKNPKDMYNFKGVEGLNSLLDRDKVEVLAYIVRERSKLYRRTELGKFRDDDFSQTASKTAKMRSDYMLRNLRNRNRS